MNAKTPLQPPPCDLGWKVPAQGHHAKLKSFGAGFGFYAFCVALVFYFGVTYNDPIVLYLAGFDLLVLPVAAIVLTFSRSSRWFGLGILPGAAIFWVVVIWGVLHMNLGGC